MGAWAQVCALSLSAGIVSGGQSGSLGLSQDSLRCFPRWNLWWQTQTAPPVWGWLHFPSAPDPRPCSVPAGAEKGEHQDKAQLLSVPKPKTRARGWLTALPVKRIPVPSRKYARLSLQLGVWNNICSELSSSGSLQTARAQHPPSVSGGFHNESQNPSPWRAAGTALPSGTAAGMF